MLQPSNSIILATIASTPTLLLALRIVFALIISFRSYLWLSHIPGPFFAKFTNLSRLLWVKSYKAHEKHVALHRRHGPIVRFRPNMVSVGDPREIGTIYSFKQPWRKVGATLKPVRSQKRDDGRLRGEDARSILVHGHEDDDWLD